MTRKIALITGASRGLGHSAALHLAAQGVNIIGTYHSNDTEAHALVSDIEKTGGSAVMLRLDVSDSASFGAFAGQVRQALNEVFSAAQFDFLVNNAGIGLSASFADTTEAQFDELMNVHLKGPFFLTQVLLPLLADGGSILNVSTGLTRFSNPGYAAYATMKGGIEVLTRYLAKELGPRGINVNAIAPGAIATDFAGGHVRDNQNINAHIAGVTALGRVGLPDDIGAAINLLLSDGGKWINGQRVEASGGMML